MITRCFAIIASFLSLPGASLSTTLNISGSMIDGEFVVGGVSIQLLVMIEFDGRSMEIRGKYGPIIDGASGMAGGPAAFVTSKFIARMLHLVGRELSDLKICRKDNIVSKVVGS